MSDIYGGTNTANCCFYWIDGNTNSAEPVIAAGATFNVDNPVFWSPNSVISGLASGLCERKAVAKLVSGGAAVVTGATVALAPGQIWTMSGGAGTMNDSIVQNAVKNIILHVGEPGEADVYSTPVADPSFRIPDKDIGNQTYMTKFDDAVMNILNDHAYTTTLNGGSVYTTYTQLSNAAYLAAAAQGTVASRIERPVSGGTNYSLAFYPAYPAAWAKERKWMLDQLRYTGATVVGALVNDLTVSRFAGRATTADVFSVTGSDTYTNGFVDWGMLTGESNQTKTGDVGYHMIGSFPTVTAATIDTTLYFDAHAQAASYEQRNIDYSSLTRITGATTAQAGGEYHVAAGGVLTIGENVEVGTVVIDRGGTVTMANGAVAAAISEFPGCTLTPYTVLAQGASVGTVQIPSTAKIAYEFTLPTAEWRAANITTCKYYHAGTTDITTPDPNVADYIWADNGAIVNVYTYKNNPYNNAYISGATVTVQSAGDVTGTLNGAVIDNGGLLVVYSGGRVEAASIRSGGTAILSGGMIYQGTIESGGTLFLAANNCSLHDFDIFDGAVINAYTGTPAQPAAITIDGTCLLSFHHFCTYGFLPNATTITDDVASGWHTLTGNVIEGTTTYTLLGTAVKNTGSDTITSYINAGLATASARITGTVVLGGATYTNPETAFKAKNAANTILCYGACITAKNRTPESTSEDHYTDFRVRQFAT